MWWLFTQIWIWILIAFVLGWAAHWFICCRGKDSKHVNSSDVVVQNTTSSVAPVAAAAPVVSESWKPKGFAERPDSVDDLKRIKGVGAVIEKTLHELGIYQFGQIAAWDRNNIQWVENFLAFPGRIDREDWIEQSKTLSQGGATAFSQRVDTGDVDYES